VKNKGMFLKTGNVFCICIRIDHTAIMAFGIFNNYGFSFRLGAYWIFQYGVENLWVI